MTSITFTCIGYRLLVSMDVDGLLEEFACCFAIFCYSVIYRMLWTPLPLMMLQLSGPMNSCSGNSSAEDEFALIQCIPQSSLLGKTHSDIQVFGTCLQRGGRNLLMKSKGGTALCHSWTTLCGT